MKSLVQFIKESKVDDAKVQKAIDKVLAVKGGKFVKVLNAELSDAPGCDTEDDFEEYLDDLMSNTKEYPARWSLICAVANVLKMDPQDLLDNSNSDLFFCHF